MSKGKLLLADDSVTIQKVVNLTFAEEGIDVITAGNGDLAMEMIAKQRPDIVLADVNMPGLNGYQICERLRQSDETKDLPVLLLVGSFEPFDEGEAKRVGASGFMTKPFQSIRLLISQVSQLLEKSDRMVADIPIGEQMDEPAGDGSLPANEVDEPQTADIEDLYNQSFANTVEIPNGEDDGTGDFADAGMDDEIIETTYVSGDAADTEENARERASHSSPFEERVSYESEKNLSLAPDAESMTRDAEESNVQSSTEFDATASEPAFDETQEMPDYNPESVWSNVVSNPGDRSTLDQEHADDRVPETFAKSYSLSESELLELPSSSPATAITNPHPASSAPNQITNISPEIIDLIVQKVLEKLSDKEP